MAESSKDREQSSHDAIYQKMLRDGAKGDPPSEGMAKYLAVSKALEAGKK